MNTHRDKPLTVTHVMEFAEECLTAFLDLCPCIVMRLFLVTWHLDQDDKIMLILYKNVYIFKVTFNQDLYVS